MNNSWLNEINKHVITHQLWSLWPYLLLRVFNALIISVLVIFWQTKNADQWTSFPWRQTFYSQSPLLSQFQARFRALDQPVHRRCRQQWRCCCSRCRFCCRSVRWCWCYCGHWQLRRHSCFEPGRPLKCINKSQN